MSIKLTWANAYNGNVSGFNIYRSLTRANLYDAGNKIQTFDTSVLNYEDTNVVPDTVYYYGVESLTPLGTMQSRPLLAVQYMNSAGPGGIHAVRGDLASGQLDTLAAGNMPDLYGIVQAIVSAGMSSFLTPNVRVTMNYVPGQPVDLISKLSIEGKVIFMPSDYKLHAIHTTAAGRQSWDTSVGNMFKDGLRFDYLGYPMVIELMTLDHALNYWIKFAGGPVNYNGWMIRAVEKPIPAYANHYVLVKDGDKLYRVRATEGRPYLTSYTEALLADPFVTANYAYPLYVIRPAE